MYRTVNPLTKIKRIFQTNAARMTKVFSAFMLVFLFLGNPALATDNSTLEQQKQQVQSQLNEATGQKLTLSAQVKAFDNQISSMQSDINNTQAELDKLAQQIVQANDNIKKAEIDIAQKKKLLGEYVKTMYINGQTSQLELILTSSNFSDFVDQSEYLQTMRSSIDGAVKQIEDAKAKLEADKKALQESQDRALSLKQQQLSTQVAVQTQRSAKDALLAATKGDEVKFKELIGNIQKEIDANNAATWGGPLVSQGHVNKGDIIGYIGSTGYSTGPHLHFEIRNASKSTLNPVNYIGNGYFIDPAPSVAINVPYGYSDAYFEGVFHTGIDKADGGRGTPIMAAADGEIVARVTGRPNTYPWSLEYGNYVMIQHTNGMFSLYGHMQS